MKLTTKSEYSLLALLYISRHQEKEYVKIENVCTKYNIDKKYLEHLMSILKNANIVKTKRGISGGYKLADNPNKISIARIIRLMDGALAPTESVSKYFFSKTPLSQDKNIIKEFKDIRNYIANKLENLTIKDLI